MLEILSPRGPTSEKHMDDLRVLSRFSLGGTICGTISGAISGAMSG